MCESVCVGVYVRAYFHPSLFFSACVARPSVWASTHWPRSTEHLCQCINMCAAVKVSTGVYCDAYYVIQQLIGSVSYKSLRGEDLAVCSVIPCRSIWGSCLSSCTTCWTRHPQTQDMHTFQPQLRLFRKVLLQGLTAMIIFINLYYFFDMT